MKLIFTCILALCTLANVNAQAPLGYYDSADSLIGEDLRMALREIIRGHTVKSYGDLWTGYRTTDEHPDGYVWDMYSHKPLGNQTYTFTFGSDQCGNYSSEGDCYNREHTWPQSMFGDATPMRTDIVLVVPTDGKVNGMRSNYPYGVVNNPTWSSTNGSKLGPNTFPNSSGTAFEPIDEYKGDIARIMFYVVTRYYKLDAGWATWEMGTKAELTNWARRMFLEWHYNDPVSVKEQDRNNAIYAYQGNRNPYVDHPEFVDCVFNPTNCNWANVVDTNDTYIPTMLNHQDISLYPNPTSSTLAVDISTSKTQLPLECQVLDMTGRVVYETSIEQPKNTSLNISLAEFASGLYILKIQNEEVFYIEKVIKR